MQPFVWAKRVALAVGAGQAAKTGVTSATMFAHIFGFLTALIQGVQTLVRACWVARTVGGGKAGDAGVFSSAIFAVVVHSRMMVGCVLFFKFDLPPSVRQPRPLRFAVSHHRLAHRSI